MDVWELYVKVSIEKGADTIKNVLKKRLDMLEPVLFSVYAYQECRI